MFDVLKSSKLGRRRPHPQETSRVTIQKVQRLDTIVDALTISRQSCATPRNDPGNRLLRVIAAPISAWQREKVPRDRTL